MATNNFKAFGIGAGANITSQADYESLAALLTGFQSGKASSAQINKALRQSSTMAYVLAQFIADSASVDVLDNGTPATILANLKSSMTALTPGRLLNVQVFTGSGTYIPTAGTKRIKVRMVGAGGAGGGTPATSSSQIAAAFGGNSGSYAESKIIDISALTSVSVTVGSAGVGVAGSPGGSGGSSAFGSYLIAPGGPGGNSGPPGAGLSIASDNVIGTASSGSSLLFGDSGSIGTGPISISSDVSSQSNFKSGKGGDSIFGGGGGGKVGGGTPRAASGFGAGGGGSAVGPSSNLIIAGGNGSAGLVIVEEFA